MPIQSVHFILYSRSYCHLCEDMLHALQKFQDRFDFSVDVIDVDSDDALVAQYDELVPVLVGVRKTDLGEMTQQLCHYFLDEQKLLNFLSGPQAQQAAL